MMEYKESGVKWIGKIPKKWKVKRVKYTTKIPVTDGPHETPNFVDEGVPFYSVDGIQNGKIIYEPCRYISTEDADRFDKKEIPIYGDILMGKAASIGKIAIIDRKMRMQIWSPLAIIRANDKIIDNKFLKYYLLSHSAQIEIDLRSTTNTQKNIAMKDIENIYVPIPDLNEQKLIANFLDEKTSKIDDILDNLNKQIEILNYYKRSLITETITKGLVPNTKMKDSGIKSIGKIPNHWNVKSIKYISNVHSSTRIFEEEYVDEGIPFFRTKEIVELANGKEISLELFITPERYNKLKNMHIKKGDLLISSIGTIGEVWISDGRKFWYKDGNITQIDGNNSFNSEFLKYFIKSNCFTESIKYYESTTTISALTIEKIKRIKIALPSLKEQNEIVAFLNEMCLKIDIIIKDKNNQIEKIEEMKKSLLYEYVTGKKRVKGE